MAEISKILSEPIW